MKFTKMHGCGNDYIYVNGFEEKVEQPSDAAVKLSDRHFGIGSDGLILIQPSDCADFRMEMYNADGSEGKMCGNGIRCVAKYVYDHGMTDRTQITVQTLSGIKTLDLTVEDGKVSTVRVNMGTPILEPRRIPVDYAGSMCVSPRGVSEMLHADEQLRDTPYGRIVQDEPLEVGGRSYRITCVSMGNPHCVVPVYDVDGLDIEHIGPLFEHHRIFPERVNTEFIRVTDRRNVKMRVWERGSGETWACGTGACAVGVACILNGWTEESMTVHLRGGDLKIEWDREQNTVFMTGPAVTVFEGEVNV